MSDSLNIFCTIPAKNGERVPISVSTSATPTQLRQLASEATSIPLSSLRLIFRGRMIKDDDATKAVDEYKLEAECVLHCIGTPVESSSSKPAAAAAAPVAAASTTTAAAPASFGAPPPTVAAAAPAAPAPPAPVIDPLQAALQTMRSSNSHAAYATAITTLEKILGNIANNPLEEKYRKVKLGNAAFQKRLGGIPGGDAAMKAVGFLVETQDGAQVYQMQASPEAWPKLMANKAAIEAAAQEAKRASAVPAVNPAPPMGVGAGAMPPMMDPAMMQNAMAGMDPAAMRSAMAGMMSNPEALRNMLQNPMVQQMIQNDPNISPMHRNAMQQLAQNPAMLNQLSQMMQDPNMRAQMEAMAAGRGMNMPGMMPNMGVAGGGNNPPTRPGGNAPPRSDQDQTEEEMIAEAIRRSLEEGGG